MVTRKQIWDTLDVIEGKEKGSTTRALKKELTRQGYSCLTKRTKFKCVKK